MSRRLTVAERLAEADKNQLLDDILAASEWDQQVVERAVFHVGAEHDEFDCNQLRELLPEQGRGFLGAAINALARGGVIEHTGRTVPSTSAATHGHRIGIWRLTVKGQHIAQQRAAAADASVGEAA